MDFAKVFLWIGVAVGMVFLVVGTALAWGPMGLLRGGTTAELEVVEVNQRMGENGNTVYRTIYTVPGGDPERRYSRPVWTSRQAVVGTVVEGRIDPETSSGASLRDLRGAVQLWGALAGLGALVTLACLAMLVRRRVAHGP